jgi:hypothetical protein
MSLKGYRYFCRLTWINSFTNGILYRACIGETDTCR